jgi:phage baseplate assembly protein W
MSVEIQVPFQLGQNGVIATISDPALIVDQHVKSLVSTASGERIMLPTYGLALAGLVFGSNDPVLLNVIKNDVISAFNLWEPSIAIQNVNPSQATDAQSGVAAVDVQYTVTNLNAVGTAVRPVTQTATMTVGGTVVSN